MTASVLLEEARTAGVELSAAPEGKLHWRCPDGLPEKLRQALAAHKPELWKLLASPIPGLELPAGRIEDGEPRSTLAEADAMEAEGLAQFYYPPVTTPVFFQDANDRPCPRAEAHLWTWAGSVSWFRAEVYPPPSWS
jgi:hypothetical protein